MKQVLLLVFCLLPWLGRGQVDTARVVAEVDSLIKEAEKLNNSGKPQDALSHAEKAEQLTYGLFGENNERHCKALKLIGSCYYYMRQYNKVEQYFIRAKNIQELVYGKHHVEYAKTLTNIALLYLRLGRYEEAGILYDEASPLFDELIGKDQIVYASYLNSLGNYFSAIDNNNKALDCYTESKNIVERLKGKNNESYIHALANSATIYKELGRYLEADACYKETMKYFETNQQTNDPDYATVLHNVALMYKTMGKYDEAELLHLKASNIIADTLGEKNYDFALSLNYLGTLYVETRRFEMADSVIKIAAKIVEDIAGKESRDYAECLTNLAIINANKTDFSKAESLFKQASQIQFRLNKDYDYAYSMFNLGGLFMMMKRYEEADSFLNESKKIRKMLFGAFHLEYVASINQLGFLNIIKGDYLKSKTFLSESFGIQKNLISKASLYLSEKDLSFYSGTFLRYFYGTLSYGMQYPKATKYLSGFCYDNALQYKGFLLQAATRLKTLAQSDTTASKLYDNLKSYRYLLSKEYAKPIAERQHVEEWEEKANTLEKELTRTVAGFGEALRQVTWQEVQQQLQPGETAIEFVHYQYHNPEPTDSVFYSALVLRPGDEAPHFVTLFEEREIAPLLAKASGKKSSRIDDFYLNGDGANGEKLYQLIWQPLRELLGGTKKVYVSPSGLLHRINLGAVPFPLQGNKGQTFADSYQLSIVGSTRQLVVKDPAAAPNANAVVFGGIRYQTDTTAMIASNETVSRSNDLPDILKFQSDTISRGGNLDYLPNSLTEALSITGTLESANFTVQLDTGYYANEEAFKQIGKYGASPRILHVATHGYFYPDPEEMVDGRRQMLDGGEQVFRNSRHPMIRSGLIMAGAEDAYFNGKSPADREDGVLTAYEISQMNLANTELVVLSACETGLGDIQGNEGVYGLQRAFKIAGAKNLIMSLWQVNDLSTNAFMTEFYRQWLRQGLEIPAAFRAAQGIVREQYPDSPYLWAGFVLVE